MQSAADPLSLHCLLTTNFLAYAVETDSNGLNIFSCAGWLYYERGLDQHNPASEYEEWLKSLFDQLFARTENNAVPGTEFTEYGFQRILNLGYHHNENTILTKSGI